MSGLRVLLVIGLVSSLHSCGIANALNDRFGCTVKEDCSAGYWCGGVSRFTEQSDNCAVRITEEYGLPFVQVDMDCYLTYCVPEREFECDEQYCSTDEDRTCIIAKRENPDGDRSTDAVCVQAEAVDRSSHCDDIGTPCPQGPAEYCIYSVESHLGENEEANAFVCPENPL
jgi:hypothetical protein